MATEHNNNIYNYEIYKKSNQESKNILEDYILEMKSRKLSPKSIEQYVYDVKMIICFAYENFQNRSLLSLGKRDFRNLFLFMAETGKSSSRINRVQSSIRNLLLFCEMDDEIYSDYTQSPMRYIKGVESVPEKEVIFLSNEKISFLVDYLISQDQLQKALYLSLSFSSAARRNEIFQVTKQPFLENSHKTNMVVCKRGKKAQLMIDKRSLEIGKMYLEQRGHDDIDSLWITGEGIRKREVGYNTLYVWSIGFRAILENEYNESLPISSHSIRHSALECYSIGDHIALKDMGVDKLDLNTLRILSNHTNSSTTEGYLRDKSADILDDLFKFG